MRDAMEYSLPRWKLTRWLTRTGEPVSPTIQAAQIQSLYGSLSIFYAAALCTLSMAFAAWWRHGGTAFAIWVAIETGTIVLRVILLNLDRRATRIGKPTRTDLYILTTFIWAMTLGYGAAITTLSGDWLVAFAVNSVTASIAGGMCIRYFVAPRFVIATTSSVLLPMAGAACLTGEPILLVIAVQTPLFLFSMARASMRLNRMMIATMEAEEANEYRALHDELTGLWNRSGLIGVVEARRRAEPANAKMTIFFLDLDRFKPINDRHGHAAGDHVLQQVADRLLHIAGDDCEVARIGGDEFVLLSPALDAPTAQQRGEEIVRMLAEIPYDAAGTRARIGVSVGASTIAGTDGLECGMRLADKALYGAKAQGGRSVKLAA
ncbi:GGDEF domain-containing protein [Parasphingopyxis marina]|uniref:diguanylate cyclase n=1 Tax=Parasphingopyxis marina TaxID=2761622 RepID=A0A842HTZ0_9SPHN|nr:GGDEF domain-containing protein [Parasphingopyxis marina]MBC2776546.1 GGDEF domain-containing protein [Parasphingopyxis marina]